MAAYIFQSQPGKSFMLPVQCISYINGFEQSTESCPSSQIDTEAVEFVLLAPIAEGSPDLLSLTAFGVVGSSFWPTLYVVYLYWTANSL